MKEKKKGIEEKERGERKKKSFVCVFGDWERVVE